MLEKGKVVNQGMGGFITPPTHPEHTHSIESVKRDSFSMSLSAAADCEWLSPETREQAKALLDAWQRPPLESAEVQEWIRQVLGYFRGCYRGKGPEPKCWNAENLYIPKKGETEDVENHAGVHLIRQYYPEYVPRPEHFTEAYWGKKSA